MWPGGRIPRILIAAGMVIGLLAQPGGAALLAPPDAALLVVLAGRAGSWQNEVEAAGGVVLADASRAGFALVEVPQLPPALPEGWYRAWDFVAAPAAAHEDPLSGEQWALGSLDMAAAWAIEPGSSDVLVAVVDSGVEAGHEDLRDASLRMGSDLVDFDGNPNDESGHGTRVAGIVAAVRGNARGVAGMANVSVLVIRALDARNAGPCAKVALGIVEAVEQGAGVINLSISCSSNDPALRLAVEHALLRDVIVVAAAGNLQLSRPEGCPTYPARLDRVLAVGAVDASLEAAASSCRGVDLVAPGVSVLATAPGGYAPSSGTSFAAPHVSAAAALLKSRWPSASAEDVASLLLATARDLGAPGADPASGRGLVQPALALAAHAG